MDTTLSPSESIHRQLEKSVVESLQSRRPILWHLNADTTWLLQLPIPSPQSTSGTHTRRHFYNLLFDPWLSGPQSDVASWFSKQWHVIPGAFETLHQVEDFCRQAEVIATAQLSNANPDQESPFIDAILISHEFTDHCHLPTLREADPRTIVFATSKAAKIVEGIKHFDIVLEVKGYDGEKGWRGLSSDYRRSAKTGKRVGDDGHLGAIPDWLGIARVVTEADAFYYHSALMVLFDLDPGTPPSGETSEKDLVGSSATGGGECLIYTPHGIKAGSLGQLSDSPSNAGLVKRSGSGSGSSSSSASRGTKLATATATPLPPRTLALLHGLDDVSISWGQQLNLGAHNGLAAKKALGAKYWVGTHDEAKRGGGVVSWFLRRKNISVKQAVQQAEAEAASRSRSRSQAGEAKSNGEDGGYLEMRSGDGKVLY